MAKFGKSKKVSRFAMFIAFILSIVMLFSLFLPIYTIGPDEEAKADMSDEEIAAATQNITGYNALMAFLINVCQLDIYGTGEGGEEAAVPVAAAGEESAGEEGALSFESIETEMLNFFSETLKLNMPTAAMSAELFAEGDDENINLYNMLMMYGVVAYTAIAVLMLLFSLFGIFIRSKFLTVLNKIFSFLGIAGAGVITAGAFMYTGMEELAVTGLVVTGFGVYVAIAAAALAFICLLLFNIGRGKKKNNRYRVYEC